MTRIATAAIVLLVVLGAGARADDKPQNALPPRVVTHHTITLNNHRIDYNAIAEALPLTDAKGTTTAEIFTVSYIAAPAAATPRPVSFVFNGGPGAASVFLDLGALGPKIMQTPADGDVPRPPVRVIDNPSSWLLFTDLVFIDPVGTGYSRGTGDEKNPDQRFWDVDHDLSSLDAVVRLWLTRHQRWDSPIYLVGESYGGFRAAAMAERLPHDADVTVSGLVLISPALDLSILHPSERDLLASAFYLPTYAATAAALGVTPPGTDVGAVERFALSDYLVGLAGLPGRPTADDPFVTRVAGMIGLPAEFVAGHRARVSNHRFAHEILRPRGEEVSLYDGTIARPAPTDQHDYAGDPLLQPIAADFGTAFNAYVSDTLDYHTDRPYEVLSAGVVRHWDWQGEQHEGGPGLALSSLEAALLTHPGTKVLIVNGRYDLVTPYLSSRWFIDQLQVPAAVRANVQVKVYPGGHMVYLRPVSRAALAADASRLYGMPGAAPSQ
ncbi:MAG TPA: alpha/beta fold hydrolase [Stellaceae bacterium]|nr:alpha/beta fold hydrolase [Stellaceae bacterium]